MWYIATVRGRYVEIDDGYAILSQNRDDFSESGLAKSRSSQNASPDKVGWEAGGLPAVAAVIR